MRCDNDERSSQDFAAVLAEYLTRIDRGEPVAREAFLAEHPRHHAALLAYFGDVDLLSRLTASDAVVAVDLFEPKEFGDYLLLEEIGRGGMGVVYRARRRLTGELVALKLLLAGPQTSPAQVLRFRNEVRTAEALDHPGIQPIYEVGEREGCLYYTMPLIDGNSLAQQLAGGPLAPNAAAQVLRSIAQAVQYAHDCGVVHRDLKPANVLVDGHNRTYVADFGLARSLVEPLGVTATGDLLGTPNYMAPEQVDGHHALVGPSADVYSMGAMLYALLVGRPPFDSRTPTATYHKILTTAPTPPCRLRAEVPVALETICLKCLEKLPAHRYRSASALAEDLQRFLLGQSPLARRPSRLERGRRWFVRNPLVGMLAVAVALVAVAGAAVSLHYAMQAGQRQREAAASLYAADMNLAQQHLHSGAVASALGLLERHRPPSGGTTTAGWEWRRLWRECHGELRRFEGPRSEVYAAAFSPDGRLAAAGGADRVIWVWETATGKVLHRLVGHAGAIRDVAFTPDGRRLVSVGDETLVRVWDVTTGEPVAALEGHARTLNAAAVSADGRCIATGGADEPLINIWDAAALTLRQSLDFGPAERLAFSPAVTRLAVAARDGRLRICAPSGGNDWSLTAAIQAHQDVTRDVAWSHDGKRLATAGADYMVRVWDAASCDELAAISVSQQSIYSVAFRPDGKRLALAARNEPLRVWDFDRQQIVVELGGDAGLVSRVCYGPQGWRLLTASEDGSVRLWDASQTTAREELLSHLSRVRSVAITPDGRSLASQDSDNAGVVLWDLATAQPRRVLRALSDVPAGVAISSSSRLLATTAGSRLCLWDLIAGKLVRELQLSADALTGVAWRPQQDVLATQARDGTIRIVDALNGKIVASWAAAEPASCLAYSPDGSRVASGGRSGAIQVWQVASRSLDYELKGQTAPIINIAFNPEGTLIASSSNDHAIRLWDATTGRQIRTLLGHAGTPFGIAFSPDGTRLASGGTDRAVKIWDVMTGLELQSIVGHADWVLDVAFTPDGETLVSAGGDRAIRLWRAGSRSPLENASLESAALVEHLVDRRIARQLSPSDLSSVPGEVIAEIKRDATISDAVRAAALRIAGDYLYYWRPMCEGHEAARRKDWAAAADAFKRAAALAPTEASLWHWLALASIAAGDEAEHARACEELLGRVAPDAAEAELRLAMEACLLTPGDHDRLTRLAPLVEAYRKLDPQWLPYPALFELRTDQPPTRIERFPETAAPQINPAHWYVAAMAWAKTGDLQRASAAYEIGVRQARSMPPTQWILVALYQTLEREARQVTAAAAEPCER